MKKKNLVILLFDDVEVLDFAGPYEVFSITNELNNYSLFNVVTVAPQDGSIIAKNGLSINPDLALIEAPKPGLRIIPGGNDARKVLEQPHVINWIRDCSFDAVPSWNFVSTFYELIN